MVESKKELMKRYERVVGENEMNSYRLLRSRMTIVILFIILAAILALVIILRSPLLFDQYASIGYSDDALLRSNFLRYYPEYTNCTISYDLGNGVVYYTQCGAADNRDGYTEQQNPIKKSFRKDKSRSEIIDEEIKIKLDEAANANRLMIEKFLRSYNISLLPLVRREKEHCTELGIEDDCEKERYRCAFRCAMEENIIVDHRNEEYTSDSKEVNICLKECKISFITSNHPQQ